MEQSSKVRITLAYITLFIIIMLIPVGIFLVQRQQTFFSKAANNQSQLTPETSLALRNKQPRLKVNQEFSVDILARNDLLDPANFFNIVISYPPESLEVIKISNQVSEWPELKLPCSGGETKFICPKGFKCLVKNVSDSAATSYCQESSGQINYIIKSFLKKDFDNQKGLLTVTGELKKPGFQTKIGDNQAYLATIIFKAKGLGAADIKFQPDSQINRSVDNLNILKITKDLSVTIN